MDILVWSCAHADGRTPNDRFSWLGKLIYDIKPDVTVDLGDGADMRSLNSFDTRYPRAVVTMSYEEDVDVYNDSQERLWHLFRHNRKGMPYRIGMEGNHEHRIKKAIDHSPNLEGGRYGISFSNLNTRHHFNEYHEYSNEGPAIREFEGIEFAHFIQSGNYGRAVSGVHHAYALIQQRHNSCIVGHSHRRGLYFSDAAGSIGAVVGCMKGSEETWAGQSNRHWWKGAVLLRDVENGMFEPQFISIKQMERNFS